MMVEYLGVAWDDVLEYLEYMDLGVVPCEAWDDMPTLDNVGTQLPGTDEVGVVHVLAWDDVLSKMLCLSIRNLV